jgi:DNA invertase Pin-like site-specific DNA recombinase
MRRAVVYLRVSTIDQTTANQERELREIAGRMGCEIVKVYKDRGISGAKGRDRRPAFDKMCRDAARWEFDVVMAWSVDRLGRSLQDLVGFLSELHALEIDLFLRQQGLDTTTPAGKAMFQMMGSSDEGGTRHALTMTVSVMNSRLFTRSPRRRWRARPAQAEAERLGGL